MPEIGDVVLFSVGQRSYNALVLFAHGNEVSHLGKNGEPLLHLAYVAPERESASAKAKPGYIPQVFIEHDVVHFSHEFSPQYKREKGLLTTAQLVADRGQGEWRIPGEKSDAETFVVEKMMGLNLIVAPAPPLHEVPISDSDPQEQPPCDTAEI